MLSGYIQISEIRQLSESNTDGFEMHFECDFSPYRNRTLTWSHSCIKVQYPCPCSGLEVVTAVKFQNLFGGLGAISAVRIQNHFRGPRGCISCGGSESSLRSRSYISCQGRELLQRSRSCLSCQGPDSLWRSRRLSAVKIQNPSSGQWDCIGCQDSESGQKLGGCISCQDPDSLKRSIGLFWLSRFRILVEVHGAVSALMVQGEK